MVLLQQLDGFSLYAPTPRLTPFTSELQICRKNLCHPVPLLPSTHEGPAALKAASGQQVTARTTHALSTLHPLWDTRNTRACS